MIENKRCKFKLVKGGWIGDDKVQNESIVYYDNLKKIKYQFTLKCIGEYEEHNEKELERLTNLLNQLLSENKLLKDNKNISDGMRLIRMTENKRYSVIYEKEPRGQLVTDDGVPCTARTCCTRLNWLEEENKKLQERNDRQYKQLGDLYRLIEQKDWRALSDIMDDFKKAEEQLQKEWKCYE